MPARPELAEPSGPPLSDLSAWLIEQHYREIGCDAWDKYRVMRLCAKIQRTQHEMAALLRVIPSDFKRKMERGFNRQDGLILTLLEAEIDVIRTGEAPSNNVFFSQNLQPANGRS